MITLSKDFEGTWEAKRGAVRRDFATIETVLNQHGGIMFGAQTAPTQVCYPLGGSTTVAVRHALANTFVDVPNAADVRLPVEVPPGAVTVIVRVSADTAGVGVTPRLIRTDTGAVVGTGKTITVVNTPTRVTTWPLCTTQEFLIQRVTHVLGQRIYYRLQVAADVANATVYACGVMVTGQAWQDSDANIATNDRTGAWGSPVIGVGGGGTGTSAVFTPGSVVFAGPAGVYSQDNANLFWDDANNRLGIGTSAPAVTLDVAGDGYFHNTASSVGVILDASASGALGVGLRRLGTPAWDMVVGAGATPGLDFRSGAAFTTRLTLLANGRVGIGTTAPGDTLDIKDGRLIFSGTMSSFTSGPGFGLASNVLYLNTPSGGFSVNNAANTVNLFNITNGGLVGIGANPFYPLSVTGIFPTAHFYNATNPGITIGQTDQIGSAGNKRCQLYLDTTNNEFAIQAFVVGGINLPVRIVQPRLTNMAGFAAGDKYVVADVNGNVHVSAVGPAS